MKAISALFVSAALTLPTMAGALEIEFPMPPVTSDAEANGIQFYGYQTDDGYLAVEGFSFGPHSFACGEWSDVFVSGESVTCKAEGALSTLDVDGFVNFISKEGCKVSQTEALKFVERKGFNDLDLAALANSLVLQGVANFARTEESGSSLVLTEAYC
ncbi:hypothetical protein [Thalassobius sp. MITS945101]|uniref:hypothetical protein n=1 Tax=Thalassobius sp. MITS945101 TaxID=3096994 RepID=UPI00399B1773